MWSGVGDHEGQLHSICGGYVLGYSDAISRPWVWDLGNYRKLSVDLQIFKKVGRHPRRELHSAIENVDLEQERPVG